MAQEKKIKKKKKKFLSSSNRKASFFSAADKPLSFRPPIVTNFYHQFILLSYKETTWTHLATLGTPWFTTNAM